MSVKHIIIDRRLNGKNKSSPNRKKFLDRTKTSNKKAVKDAITNGKISDIANKKTENVNVPVKDISEPHFHHDQGGYNERVFPGNKDFTVGDRIPRPQGGGQGSGQGSASDSGEGEDEFVYTITRDEFLDYFFEDLELHDLEDKELAKVVEYKYKRAGFTTDGDPARMNLLRTMKQSTSRRIALSSKKKKKLKELEAELIQLSTYIIEHPGECEEQQKRAEIVKAEIDVLRKKIKRVPFIDEIDLRYSNSVKVAVPSSQAVMFCIMDVSGSMGEWEKEMSKRFFMLLYLFLFRNYEKIEVVFIRHTTEAKEVDEEEFFHSRETGGTKVSPALDLMYNIIMERYPRSAWNIYACQASDGDNWDDDNARTLDMLTNKILPLVQYYAYVESNSRDRGDLWPHYEKIAAESSKFDMAKIKDASDIYPVFRGLFEKK